MTVAEAAKLMGVSPQFVRIGLQRGLLPIGAAVKLRSRWAYYISPELLERFTKKTEPLAATSDPGEAAQNGPERTP